MTQVLEFLEHFPSTFPGLTPSIAQEDNQKVKWGEKRLQACAFPHHQTCVSMARYICGLQTCSLGVRAAPR